MTRAGKPMAHRRLITRSISTCTSLNRKLPFSLFAVIGLGYAELVCRHRNNITKNHKSHRENVLGVRRSGSIIRTATSNHTLRNSIHRLGQSIKFATGYLFIQRSVGIHASWYLVMQWNFIVLLSWPHSAWDALAAAHP